MGLVNVRNVVVSGQAESKSKTDLAALRSSFCIRQLSGRSGVQSCCPKAALRSSPHCAGHEGRKVSHSCRSEGGS